MINHKFILNLICIFLYSISLLLLFNINLNNSNLLFYNKSIGKVEQKILDTYNERYLLISKYDNFGFPSSYLSSFDQLGFSFKLNSFRARDSLQNKYSYNENIKIRFHDVNTTQINSLVSKGYTGDSGWLSFILNYQSEYDYIEKYNSTQRINYPNFDFYMDGLINNLTGVNCDTFKMNNLNFVIIDKYLTNSSDKYSNMIRKDMSHFLNDLNSCSSIITNTNKYQVFKIKNSVPRLFKFLKSDYKNHLNHDFDLNNFQLNEIYKIKIIPVIVNNYNFGEFNFDIVDDKDYIYLYISNFSNFLKCTNCQLLNNNSVIQIISNGSKIKLYYEII